MALFGTDPLDELLVPDGTHAQEHDLVTDGDVIVASQSAVEFGVRGGNVIAGERVEFGGDIEADGDCRLDTWCDVAGNVLVGGDAYLGERAHIGGELRVAGNVDIGDDVQIDEGFEASGWIVIRNPMPTVVFLFVYLSQLLRIGEEDAAEELLEAVTDADDRENQPVLIPRGSRVGDDSWRVSTPGRIGDNCRLHGNIRAESLVVGRDNELFGSLRARQGITVGSGTDVAGNVTTRDGTVRIGPGTTVRGDVAGEFVEVHREATVEGAIRAGEEMSMVSEPVLDDAVVASPSEQTPADESGAGSTDTPADDSAAGSTDTPADDSAATAVIEDAGADPPDARRADSPAPADETDGDRGDDTEGSAVVEPDGEGTDADGPGVERAEGSTGDTDPGDDETDVEALVDSAPKPETADPQDTE